MVQIEQNTFKAGAAQAAAAFSTKTTVHHGNVKGGGVSLRSSRPLTYRCAVGQSGIRSAKNTDNWEWIRLQSCRLPVHFFVIFYASHRFYSFDDFAKQLAVRQRQYNNFPMRPLNWKSPRDVLFSFPTL